MNARQLFQEGKVKEAQQALSAWLRNHPDDITKRTFLFELLCFSGDWERAERQLGVLAQGSPEREMGAVLYRSALYAERTRHEMFASRSWPDSEPRARVSGTVNGRQFHSICDADPAIGARLEIFAAGTCLWLPFEHIRSICIQAPLRLRDTLWTPAAIQTGPLFDGRELGEVLVPVLYPFSWTSPNESVWLGRETLWVEDGGREHPLGQKTLLVDDEEVPLLEIRELEFEVTQAADHA